jgi:hypothetical protein
MAAQQPAGQRPDFTGVWTTYTDPAQGRGGRAGGRGAGPGLPFADEAKKNKVGDRITVYAAPLRSGADGGYVTAATTGSGQRFGPRSSAEAAAEREKAEDK